MLPLEGSSLNVLLVVLVHARRLWFDRRRRRGVWWVSLGVGGVAFWGQADRGDRTSRAQRGGDPPQLVEAGGFAGDRWAQTRTRAGRRPRFGGPDDAPSAP